MQHKRSGRPATYVRSAVKLLTPIAVLFDDVPPLSRQDRGVWLAISLSRPILPTRTMWPHEVTGDP